MVRKLLNIRESYFFKRYHSYQKLLQKSLFRKIQLKVFPLAILSYFKIYFIWHLLFSGLAAKCTQ